MKKDKRIKPTHEWAGKDAASRRADHHKANSIKPEQVDQGKGLAAAALLERRRTAQVPPDSTSADQQANDQGDQPELGLANSEAAYQQANDQGDQPELGLANSEAAYRTNL
ncbi:MAG: hypothetical protein ABSE80_11475 [Halobacteriota archaeon]|jgi:hypothetical protein